MKVNANDGPDARRATVYLNDQKLAYCVEADDDAGYVLVARHTNGEIVFDAQGDAVLDRMEGDVRIEPSPARA